MTVSAGSGSCCRRELASCCNQGSYLFVFCLIIGMIPNLLWSAHETSTSCRVRSPNYLTLVDQFQGQAAPCSAICALLASIYLHSCSVYLRGESVSVPASIGTASQTQRNLTVEAMYNSMLCAAAAAAAAAAPGLYATCLGMLPPDLFFILYKVRQRATFHIQCSMQQYTQVLHAVLRVAHCLYISGLAWGLPSQMTRV
jgi:hypothetical protein